PQMKRIWSEESKIKRMIRVEMAILKALANKGYLDISAVNKAKKQSLNISTDRVKEIEAEIKHDIMALVRAISEVSGEASRWVHFGATSNDITDTATATQLRDSLKLMEFRIKKLLVLLSQKAEEYRDVVCLGRTHGQPALPTTYGLRFAIWASEMGRQYIRLQQLRDRLLVGIFSGAVGTQAALGEEGIELEEDVMRILGLKPAMVSSQIIPRDIYCEYIEFLSNVATTLEKIATNFRILQRAEVGEISEKFEEKQVGSSTMPHKRNPIDSENICGLARVIRGFVEPQHQSAILWEERDLSNSSAERITLLEPTVLTDHILSKMTKVVESMSLDMDNIKRNMDMHKGLNLSEAVMVALTRRGMGRQEAHELVREASLRTKTSLYDELAKSEEITRYISSDELKEILKPQNYLGTAGKRVDRTIEWVDHLLR
ncbi:MAG: adenylosuccinate lyase, partial [Candidatus Hadarchaeota archaeon]